jgi:hypothetical protein
MTRQNLASPPTVFMVAFKPVSVAGSCRWGAEGHVVDPVCVHLPAQGLFYDKDLSPKHQVCVVVADEWRDMTWLLNCPSAAPTEAFASTSYESNGLQR